MAFLPSAEQQRLVRQMRLTAKTPRTITSRTAFLAELAAVRRQGFAENRGESQSGMCSIAAPIRDPFGHVVASISIAEYVDDVEAGLRHLTGRIVEAAVQISSGLGEPR